jgi:hypothetical protein
MKFTLISGIFITAIGLSACTTATPVGTTTLTNTYSVTGGTWRSGASTQFHVQAFEHESGMTSICGAVFYTRGPNVDRFSRELARQYAVYSGQTKIAANLAFLKVEPSPTPDAPGAVPVDCYLTDVPWQGYFAGPLRFELTGSGNFQL